MSIKITLFLHVQKGTCPRKMGMTGPDLTGIFMHNKCVTYSITSPAII